MGIDMQKRVACSMISLLTGDCPRVADEKRTTFASLYDTLGRYSCNEIDLKLWRFHLEILNINNLITIS